MTRKMPRAVQKAVETIRNPGGGMKLVSHGFVDKTKDPVDTLMISTIKELRELLDHATRFEFGAYAVDSDYGDKWTVFRLGNADGTAKEMWCYMTFAEAVMLAKKLDKAHNEMHPTRRPTKTSGGG